MNMTLRKASLWALAALTMALGSCRKVDADISSTSVLNASANRTAMDEYIERESHLTLQHPDLLSLYRE